MQKLCSSKEHASGQKNNPWKQDISTQSNIKKHKLELGTVALEEKVLNNNIFQI